VINALRMRPDRILIGECRGGEALDMMQAMNTGHDGSMTTCHANTARDAFSRLETMVMMASSAIPDRVIRQMLASAVQIVIQVLRLIDGSRKILSISEVTGVEEDFVDIRDIFVFDREGIDARGKAIGVFRATGYKPLCLDRLRAYGQHIDENIFSESVRVGDTV
jgi:pilus assembly protein CpaF